MFMFMFNLDFCFLTFVKWLFASSIQICVLPVYKYNIDFAIWQLTSISIKLLYFDCLQEQPRICGKQNSIWNDKISTNLWWLLLISCRLSWGLSSNDRISTNLWWLLLISCRLWWGLSSNDRISTNLCWLLLISCRLWWGLSSNDRISTNLWWLLLISCRLWWGLSSSRISCYYTTLK